MYDAVNTYLSTKLFPSIHRIEAHKLEKDQQLSVSVDKNQDIPDSFHNGAVEVKLSWALRTVFIDNHAGSKTEVKYFELVFYKKHKETVLNSYLPYVLQRAKEIKEERKTVRLHTVDYDRTDYWRSVALTHPSTFETVAMETAEMKEDVMEDLDRFIGSREYYRRVGKAWKRGYLLYGPPGTGKSSLVAAMANYLKFDVYDLDLREVKCNSDLRRLLIGMGNRSIVVIEDIDCVVGLQNRGAAESEGKMAGEGDDKITPSGLLNFIDGLWSSCGDERIIVFTTNHKDRLDPALLRPGRMDIHIHMSYCTFPGFKTLVMNYLKIREHPLFDVIQDLLAKVEATPAEIAGQLMKNGKARTALQDVINYLRNKEHNISKMELHNA
ncbi:hypothetical protein RHSIM_Rhsim06G0037100 [Rhododendron simsii]|uniref:AAA+ ATPase domain-containing protein n=1 Tax=Rhododendron simsii TaxID=118357 RepID=A0A834GYW5_RHOSS|nr:hypothetical protein RHSIM_Rhsim06G0037100 [Rhododendron simsii]